MNYSPPGSSVHGTFQARNYNRLPFPPPGDLPHPGIEPTSFVIPDWPADSLPLTPPKEVLFLISCVTLLELVI